jgi:hypothetical protein
VALVANDVSFSPLTFSMFGWRRGLLESRGFYVSEGSGELSSPAPASTDGGLDGN